MIVVADDPGMHSSQGEQDTRRFCQVRPRALPGARRQPGGQGHGGRRAGHQRAFDTPVMLRTDHSHLALHSAGGRPAPERPAPRSEPLHYRTDPAKYVMVPANARARHPVMEARMARPGGIRQRLCPEPHRVGRPSPGHRHRRHRLPVRPRGVPRGLVPQAGDDLPAAQPPGGRLRRRGGAPDRHRGAGPVHRRRRSRLQGLACEGKSIFPMIGEFDQQVVRASA